MDAPGKWGTPPFAQVASRYPIAPAASDMLSFPKTSFFVPKISFWLCWQSFLFDLQHIQWVRAIYSCAATSPTYPSEAQHTLTGTVCFPPPVFLLYLEPVFWLSCPVLGLADALSLELAQGFTPCPQTGGPAQVGGSWPDVPAWGLAVGGRCLSFLPAPLWQPGELKSSWDCQKSRFVFRFQI